MDAWGLPLRGRVLSLQGHREKSKSRTTDQKVVTLQCPARKVRAPSAHALFSGDSEVSRLSGLWYDFSTFLGVPAGTAQIVTTFSSMLRLCHTSVRRQCVACDAAAKDELAKRRGGPVPILARLSGVIKNNV